MKATLSRAELHALFAEELARDAPPESVFVFEIERKGTAGDGCNWYPLASMGSWKGEVMENLAIFRRVRERLSADYDLAPSETPAGAPLVPSVEV